MKSKAKTVSEADQYIAVLVEAAKTHAACAPLAGKIANALFLALRDGLRRPNDWEYHYSGSAEFRWYDGDSLSGSTKHVSLTVYQGGVMIGGRIGEDRYASGGGIRIEGLTAEDAATIVRILVAVVDAKKPAKKEGV